MDEIAALLRDAERNLRTAERNLHEAEADLLEHEPDLADARTCVSLANDELNAATASADHSRRVLALDDLANATDCLRDYERSAAAMAKLRDSAAQSVSRALEIIRRIKALAHAATPPAASSAPSPQNSTPLKLDTYQPGAQRKAGAPAAARVSIPPQRNAIKENLLLLVKNASLYSGDPPYKNDKIEDR